MSPRKATTYGRHYPIRGSGRPDTTQPTPPSRSWWLGLSREAFQAEAKAEEARMRQQAKMTKG